VSKQRAAHMRVDLATVSPESAAGAVLDTLPGLIRLIVAGLHDVPHTAGMNLAQFRVLARLSRRDYRVSELASTLDVGRPTLTATINTLERRDLVARLRDVPHDRRVVLLHLTPAGRALYRKLKGRAIATVADLLAEVAPAEREALVSGLAALGERIGGTAVTSRRAAAPRRPSGA
jgi:DNA-binding MarR family transcriptional regulator